MGVHEGGTLGGGLYNVNNWFTLGTGQKCCFLGFFWKITTYWPPLDERVRSSFTMKLFVRELQKLESLYTIFMDFMYKKHSFILKKNGL